jgi:CheY-like chemotaxis protein
LTPRSILLVDDSAVVRATAGARLAGLGVRVVALASAHDAAAVDVAALSGALLDIELGDGFGPDVAARLRHAAPALPIAFLTAGATSARIDAAYAIGPVFDKVAGVDEAVAWIVAASRG